MDCFGNEGSITRVPGVKVGHYTIHDGDIHTGVTAILPHEGDIFHNKCIAAMKIINGFGKSIGIIQLNELGTLETPIILTNTLSVGTCTTALVKRMLRDNADIGDTTGTVNPVVMECNDGYLSDIRGLHIKEEHVFSALDSAATEFEQGAVGAGAGMSCFSLKGGIGTASREFELYGKTYTVGALTLTNFGSLGDLLVHSERVGERLKAEKQKDMGSVIVILATDAPMSHRQLMRMAGRAQNGLALTGGITGNGSGEVVLAFSTAQTVPHNGNELLSMSFIRDDDMDKLFRAVRDSVEGAVLSSMLHAKRTVGRKDRVRESLADKLSE